MGDGFCECASNWRIELVTLVTGVVSKVVVPVSFEFEMTYLGIGKGSISFNRHGVVPFGGPEDPSFFQMLQLYPRSVGIYFSRTRGGSATPVDPVPMFAGLVETFDASSDGLVTLGFNEIQSYLDYRLIRSYFFQVGDQRSIARGIVDYARGENNQGDPDPIEGPGIQLLSDSVPGLPATLRVRRYYAEDRKTLGDALREFLAIIGGPTYRMVHERGTGMGAAWTSTVLFSNEWEQDEPFPVITWDHLTDFKFMVDGNGTANLVDAFGEPDEEGNALIATYYPGSTFANMPRYDAAPTYDTVSEISTLQEHAMGYQADHADLAGKLQLNMSGLDYGNAAGMSSLNIGDLVPGNEVSVDIRSPHWSIRGGYTVDGSDSHPRIGRLSVAVGLEGPEQVTVQIMEERFSRLVLPNDSDLEPCVDCA